MLKKTKNQIITLSITGLIGAGSLFSGVAAQSVYAQENAVSVSGSDNVTYDQKADIETNAPDIFEDKIDPIVDVTKEDVHLTDEAKKDQQEKDERSDDTGEDHVNDEKSLNDPAQKETNTGGVGSSFHTENTQKTEAEQVKNGWIYENGGYKYYNNGIVYTGWHWMGSAEGEKTPHWSYFDKDGKMYTGWKYMGKNEGEETAHWSYFGDNGWLRTGWVQLGKGTANPDGNAAAHWSYFGDNGWLRTGWVQLGKGTANPDGNAAVHWSYFGDNGWLRTGWVQLGKGTANPDGNAAAHWSYFGNNGWLRTGWVQLGKGTAEPDGNSEKHWSYFGDNGWLRTGLQSMGQGTANPDGNSARHLSYFGNNGWLRVNTRVYVNNAIYNADGRGWLIDGAITWNSSWQYAGYSKIHSGSVMLYRSTAGNRKNVTVAVNAGHGTKGGSSVKTLCHPDGTPKVTGGSTAAGSTVAAAVSTGTTLLDGTTEADVALELAKLFKQKLLDAGYDVLMIRESADVQIDNIARAVYANNCADYHISLHYDSTTTDKGFYYIGVPNVDSYRRMEPVASNWRGHEALGQALLTGVRNNGLKVYGSGSIPTDLTQTSYSTIPSVSVEVGDRASSHTRAKLEAIAKALTDGMNSLVR